MSRNEPRGPDGYDPVNEAISHVLLGLIIIWGLALIGLIGFAFWCGCSKAHAASARHTPHPHARPHFHYDVQPVYGHKMVDDVPYVGFTTDLLRDLRCCHALEH